MSLRGIPLLILSLLIYNAIVMLNPSLSPQDIFYGHTALDEAGKAIVTKGGPLFSILLPSGAVHIWLGDMLMAVSIFLMGIEMVKATYTRGFGLVDRLLSPLLFVLFLVEFLLVPRCSTSLFFFLTFMSGIDVVVGEVIGIRSAGRNINFGGANN